MPPFMRSILAIGAGFVLIPVITIGIDLVLMRAMPAVFGAPDANHDLRVLVIGTAYTAVTAIACCWLTAALAPNRPMRHALILGALGVAATVLTLVPQLSSMPLWFAALSVLLVMPYAWLGGRLRELQLQRRGGAGTALAG